MGQRILYTLRQKMEYRGQSVEMCVSVGVAHFPDHATTWNDILRAADLALYRAKKVGRNRAIAFDASMLVEAEKRFEVLGFVRQAVERSQIVPFYQPQMAVETGEIVGFEALARIVDGDGRIRQPKEFLSALDDPEISRIFGQQMIEAVIRDVQVWHETGLEITRVAINVSSLELRHDDYAERVIAKLRANCLRPDQFEIEITESATLDENIPAIGNNLRALAAEGISVALDDFGTGYASLTHIKSMPIGCVKIDRSFISNIVSDSESRSIVGAIVALSHSLGKCVVAEGVEDPNSACTLVRPRVRHCAGVSVIQADPVHRNCSIPIAPCGGTTCCALSRNRPFEIGNYQEIVSRAHLKKAKSCDGLLIQAAEHARPAGITCRPAKMQVPFSIRAHSSRLAMVRD